MLCLYKITLILFTLQIPQVFSKLFKSLDRDILENVYFRPSHPIFGDQDVRPIHQIESRIKRG